MIPVIQMSVIIIFFNQIKLNTLDDIYAENDRLLWLNLTHCCFLRKNHRQAEDPVYASFLERLKYKKCTLDDYKMIKDRVITDETNLESFSEYTTIVSQNNLKEELNKLAILEFSSTNKTPYK